MPKKPETLLKEKVLRDLKELRARSNKRIKYTKIQQRTIRGTPDISLIVAGFGADIELKKDSFEKPDSLQCLSLLDTIYAGGFSFVVCPENWKDIFNLIQNLTVLPVTLSMLSEKSRFELLERSCSPQQWKVFQKVLNKE